MRIARWITIVCGVLIVGISALVFFAGKAANVNCDEIAAEAKRGLEKQDVQVAEITDVVETSQTMGRGTGERRCTGQAKLADGSVAPLYMRAYEEDGNLMVQYSPTPIE